MTDEKNYREKDLQKANMNSTILPPEPMVYLLIPNILQTTIILEESLTSNSTLIP